MVMERYRLRPHEIDVVRYTQEMHDRLLAIEWPERGFYKIEPGLVGGVEGAMWKSDTQTLVLSDAYTPEVGWYIVKGEITERRWLPMRPENLDRMYEPVHTDTAVEPV